MKPSSSLPRFGRRLLRLFLDPTAYEVIIGDLEEEMTTEILPRRGPRAARRWFRRQVLATITARRRFRSPRSTHLSQSSPSGDSIMQTLWQELRFGLRVLRKSPAFTFTAVLTLAFGLGANTVIFGVMDTLLLRPLPYHEADRVHFLLGWDLRQDRMSFQMPLADYEDYRHESHAFEDLAAYQNWSVNLSGDGTAERLQGYRVTVNALPLLGVRPALGGGFGAEHALPGGDSGVLLSHRLWQRRFGGDEGVVDQTILLNGKSHEILGVMPAGFEFPVFNFRGDLWAPLVYDAAALSADRTTAGSVTVVGRLGEGVEGRRAQAEVDALAARLAEDHPETNAHRGVRLIPMQELISERMRPALLVAFGGVGFVLILVCANLAGLQLARAVARRREIAVRATLGASGGRLVRQLLVETALLCLPAAAGGLLLAAWGLRALRSAVPEFFARAMPMLEGLGLDARAALFCLGLTTVTAALFGLVPALRATRGDLQTSLKEGGGNLGPVRQRLRSSLVVAQVALSLVLLLVTGLLLRTSANLLAVDPGVDSRGVLAATVSLRPEAYTTVPQALGFFEQVVERMTALPGVESAGWVNTLPFSTSGSSRRVAIEGRPPESPSEVPRTDFRVVSADYLRTLRIPLLEGRGIEAMDRGDSPPVVVINDTFRRRHFPEGDTIGRRIQLQGEEAWRTVVGVVGNVLHWQLTEPAAPEVYVPLNQHLQGTMTLALRAGGGQIDTLPVLLRREMQVVDAGQPLYDLISLEELVANSMLQHTVALVLMAIFGLAALVLALLGLYGVISYAVQQRTSEIGIRIALGAGKRDVLRLVLRQGTWLVTLGTAIGLVAGFGVSRLTSALLYGVEPTDPLTYILVTSLLAVAGVAACSAPAQRAARVDPLTAIRAD